MQCWIHALCRFLALRKSLSVVKITACNESDQVSAFGGTCSEVNKLQAKYLQFPNTYPKELISFCFSCRVLLTHSKLCLLPCGITFLCILWILRPHVWKSNLLHSKHRRPETFLRTWNYANNRHWQSPNQNSYMSKNAQQNLHVSSSQHSWVFYQSLHE